MKIAQHLEEHKEEYKRWLTDNEQGRIDIKILPYLKDIDEGTFIEAGALDGLFMSNTKLLEDLGWNGVLVEPSKKACDKCLANRRCSVVFGALVSSNYKEETIFGDFFYGGEEGLGAWSSINRNQHALKEKIPVPATTLTNILTAFGIKRVDFLSLDVEGYELKALKGLDFSQFEITYILVEVNLNDYDLEDMDEFLRNKGYKNLANLSNFTKESNPGWDGSHQDYLYKRI